MSILVTGIAGFIGMSVADRLMQRGESVIGIDNFTPYYSLDVKRARIEHLYRQFPELFGFLDVDFGDWDALNKALGDFEISKIVHLGAQPGVRYSLDNPRAYVHSNISGHLNILEIARHRAIEHLVYASSSSVYGMSKTMPLKIDDRVDQPVSLYAATKRSDELISESYSHLFRIPQTGLRFFTVYGPWGRPDMAVWKFTAAILSGKPIEIFNGGDMRRDFTYIDDIVSGVAAVLDCPPIDDDSLKPGGFHTPHRIYNIGNSRSEELMRLIGIIESATGKQAVLVSKPMQPGDVYDTFADVSDIERDFGFTSKTTIDIGIPKFVDWFNNHPQLH